jgi:hypothetical protein
MTPPSSWIRRVLWSVRIRLTAAFPTEMEIPERAGRRPVWQVLTTADLPREERVEMGRPTQ